VGTRLYLAPAGCGKTAYVIEQARAAAAQLQAMPRICVASPLQWWAVQRRIAEAGGAIGIHTVLFSDLYRELLLAAGESGEGYTLLSDPVQYRLLRTLVRQLDLSYFARLVDRPGFIQVLQELIAEFKGARIDPAALARALPSQNGRLAELVAIYAAYQERLQNERWADRPGMGWLALEALQLDPGLGARWQWLLFDGFDSFTVTQLDFLAALKDQVGDLLITLTGETDGPGRSAHRRFVQTRYDLEAALGVTATALPATRRCDQPALRHLESGLFRGERRQQPAGGAIGLLAAPDRAGEVREALRWLKEQHMQRGLPLHQFALLARDLDPYAHFIAETAAAFGLPIYAPDGPPLMRNPLIAALLDLLRLLLPAAGSSGEYALPRAAVIAAWQSPYFAWSPATLPASPATVVGIQPGDAETLDEVARRGRVVGGQQQWLEALQVDVDQAAAQPILLDGEDDKTGAARPDLLPKFQAFVARLQPPPQATFRDYVAWLEALIGDDPQAEGSDSAPPTHSLQVLASIDQGEPPLPQRDRAALLAFKEILRGLVVAEAALREPQPVSFAAFFDELAGAVEAGYLVPTGNPEGALIVANVPQARGLPFADVAVLGLGEGSFPATLREDPFLREDDRAYLRDAGFRLESSILSREREYFYETVTRPWQRLLLLRGRIADDGASWEPSPFWHEVRNLIKVAPVELGSLDVAPPHRTASRAELLQSLVAHRLEPEPYIAHDPALQQRWRLLQRSARIFRQRYQRRASPHDGDLQALVPALHEHFGERYVWSASQIETYLSCAHRFLCERPLALAPRPEGDFALDPAQLGAIYHRILEQVYDIVPAAQRTDAPALQAALEEVAPRVLDAAPASLGFRPTAWWDQTRTEITQTLATTLDALAAAAGDFIPLTFERRFGREQPLILRRDGQTIRLGGIIDRVDRDQQGRLRVVDYKSAGAQRYNDSSLRRGEHVQLPLYALAAERALALGPVAEGYYWHIRDARPSPLQLRPDNLEDYVAIAADHTWQAVTGARAGDFGPEPPAGGCPAFCSAAAFCWHYRPGFRP
jgi:ATP-dependent helicase/DNAse subunit B